MAEFNSNIKDNEIGVFFCEDLYLLYKDGTLLARSRVVNAKHGTRVLKERIKKSRPDSNGYIYYSITTSSGIPENHRLHRLLCYCFKYQDGFENLVVNHIDGDKQNNCLGNLELCSFVENIQHAWNTGLYALKDKADYKIQNEAFNFLYNSGWSGAKIAKAFGKTSESVNARLKQLKGGCYG
jgi:hypothetical protein